MSDDWQEKAKSVAQKLPMGSRVSAWLDDFFANARKILWFGLMGAVGCLIGAIIGELFLLASAAAAPTVPQVDVMFVLDVTGSMQAQIDGVRKGILQFSKALSEQDDQKLDARIGLIAYRDETQGEPASVLKFGNGEVFTTDNNEFSGKVGQLVADGGGDTPESSLDALVLASEQPFRPNATRVLLLITDAPPKVPDAATKSVAAAQGILEQNGVDQLHLVIVSSDESVYTPLQEDAPGEVFRLDDMAEERENFARVLPKLGETIAEATRRSLNSRQGAGPQSFLGALISIGLWTACLAAGVGLALIIGQNLYLRRADLVTPTQAVAGGGGGLAAGFLAGAVGQTLYSMASSVDALELVGAVLAWTLLGFLVGRGMAFFVPNLEGTRAGIGGAIGGGVAAIGFLSMSQIAGDMPGRFLGATILGFFLGLMIALIEAASRAFWLEVRYGQKEIIKVSLGATPVSIGSNSRSCTVYARDARPLAYHYKLVDGQVVCVDFSTEKAEVVPAGDERQIGQVWVTVKGGTHGSEAPPPGASAGGKAPPPPPGKPGAAPPPPVKPGPTGAAPTGAAGAGATPVGNAPIGTVSPPGTNPKPPVSSPPKPAGGMAPPPPPPSGGGAPRKPPEKRADQSVRPIPPPPPPPGGKS